MLAAEKEERNIMRTHVIFTLTLPFALGFSVGLARAAEEPSALTDRELFGVLQSKLGPEAALVPLPFLSDDRIAVWARELTKNCSTPEQRAEALHDALVPLRAPRSKGRTALEVFEQRTTETDGFGASELARLYVALARSLGLNAVCVYATADPLGRSINEVCAGVIFDGRLVVVDPGFQMFAKITVRLADGSVEERRVMRILQSYDIQHRRVQPLSDVATAAALCGERALLLNDAEDAVRLADIGVRLAPELPLVQVQLAQVYVRHARPEDALAPAARAVDLDPKNALYRVLLADIHAALGQNDLAEAELAAAVDLDDQNADAALKLAWLRYLRGDCEGAAELSAHAAAMEPEMPPALSTLGLTLLCSGEPERAVAAYKTAIATYGRDDLRTAAADLVELTLSRDIDAGRYCLGLLYEAIGFPGEARSSFEAYVARCPDGPFAEDARSRLGALSDVSTPGG